VGGNPANVEDKGPLSWNVVAAGVVVIVGVWLGAGFAIWKWMGPPDGPGTFGDMFGVVNALFSGLAFGGVIYAIFLQRRELELQRQELEWTREELERAANAQEATEAALAKQAQIMSDAATLDAASTLLALHSRRVRLAGQNYRTERSAPSGMATEEKEVE